VKTKIRLFYCTALFFRQKKNFFPKTPFYSKKGRKIARFFRAEKKILKSKQ